MEGISIVGAAPPSVSSNLARTATESAVSPLGTLTVYCAGDWPSQTVLPDPVSVVVTEIAEPTMVFPVLPKNLSVSMVDRVALTSVSTRPAGNQISAADTERGVPSWASGA
jgi:hypothetical protein